MAVDPNADLSGYLSGLSPDQLVDRYSYLTDHPELVASQIYGTQDNNNLFAFQLAKKTLGRNPAASEIIAGAGLLTAGNVGAILAAQQTATAAPPNQAAANGDSAATGVAAPATSSPGLDLITPGGTPASYASMYSYGSAPTTFAAPPSDNTGTYAMLSVLVGAVILYFGVLKHG